jgi:hypothetical protein
MTHSVNEIKSAGARTNFKWPQVEQLSIARSATVVCYSMIHPSDYGNMTTLTMTRAPTSPSRFSCHSRTSAMTAPTAAAAAASAATLKETRTTAAQYVFDSHLRRLHGVVSYDGISDVTPGRDAQRSLLLRLLTAATSGSPPAVRRMRRPIDDLPSWVVDFRIWSLPFGETPRSVVSL